ncbi:Threonine--tRNA ligase|nr:Threonine--tRNA ligase [Neochlamydia sp. AcF84]
MVMTNPLKTLRQSAAELLALAICSLFPKAQLFQGEATDLGFYYDFFLPEAITHEQFLYIEERMRDFMRQSLPFKPMEMMRKNAIELFKHQGQTLKVILLKACAETLVHVCQVGEFYDWVAPPFVETTKQVGAFKLLEVSSFKVSLPGRPNLSLTRIQGTVFSESYSLKQFLKKREIAKQCDHRQLGQQMNLFTILDETCPGCWTWYPKGVILREILLNWLKAEYQRQGCQWVTTPTLVKQPFADSIEPLTLRFEAEGLDYALCASKASLHASLYKSKPHSYQELPLAYAEYAEFYNQGKEIHQWGMLRSRSFHADQSHIFCGAEQLLDVLISSLQFINKTIKVMGFGIQWHLIVKSRKYKKLPKKWEESQASLVRALDVSGFKYVIDKEPQEYYGPAIEARFTDILGRDWKSSCIYIDLYHPDKMGLSYPGQDGKIHAPVMVGRAVLGSIERLTAILLEHYAGNLPLWLVPEQIRIIPEMNKNFDYAIQVFEEIEKAGFRVSMDDSTHNVGLKIQAAHYEKIPYLVRVGDKEEENRTVIFKKYQQESVQEEVLNKFLEQLKLENELKT